MRRLYKKLTSSVLLLVFLLNLLPTAALATGTCTKTEGCQLAADHSGFCENGNTFTVYDYEQFKSAIARVNSESAGEYIISLGADITDLSGSSNTDLSFTKNTTTILGNGHTMHMAGGTAHVSAEGPHTVVNFGVSDGSDTLVIDGTYTGPANRTMSLVHVLQGATLYMYKGVTICHGSAPGQAGGVQLSGTSKFNMYGGTITDCVNWASVAGAVYLEENSVFTMYDGLIENCSGLRGGAVGIAGADPIGSIDSTLYPATFHMMGGTIRDCTDYYYGGGAVCLFSYGYPAVFIMDGGTITGCSAKTTSGYPYGGAIIIYQTNPTGKVELNAGEISRNKAKIGGGIFAWKGTVTISDGFKLYDNTASSGGDDIYNHYANLTLGAVSAGSVLRCGHPVDGWYDDGTGESRWSCTVPTEKFTGVSVPSGYALKAAHGSGHTVTFDTQGGSTVPSQTVFSGTADVPDVPTKDDYEFAGWYKDALCTQRYDFSSPVTANITLYAKWVQRLPPSGGTGGSGGGTSAYTLRYQSNGGTPCPDETKTSAWSKDYDSLPVPVREGYLFTGWFADSGLQTPISEDVQVNCRLVTIYAGWEKSMVPAMLNGDDHYAYVEGYSDGTVRPNDNITRAEVATLFFRLLKDEIRDENLSDTNTFADVTEEMWCNKAISTMALLGIVKGRTAACFDPNAPITRAEFAAICARFDQSDVIGRSTFTDIDNHWAKEEIERAAALGWVWSNTNGTFRPQDYITRAEAMTMINRMLQRVPESAEDLLPDMITWPDNKPDDWYYLAVQEATNSHDFTRKISGYETWTALTRNRDWSVY